MRAMAFDPAGAVRAGPAVILGSRDLGSLRALVERHAGGPAGALADQLGAELGRAIVVPQAHVPGEIVALGSRVAFEELETALRREVVLALPEEARAAGDRLSILSPLGVALLGAAAGETVPWATPNGRGGELRILSVARETHEE